MSDEYAYVAPTTCKGTTKDGQPCARPATRGSDWCHAHRPKPAEVVVGTPRARKTPKVDAGVLDTLRRQGIEVGETVEPTEVLRWCVTSAAEMAALLRGDLMSMMATGEADEKAVGSMLRRYVDLLEATRKACESDVSAGVQKRRLQLDEAKAAAVGVAIERALVAAGMPDTWRSKFEQALASELRALKAAEAAA